MGWVAQDLAGVPRTSIAGIDRTMSEINRRLEKFVGYGSLGGILKAIAFLRKEMDRTYPKIPVDYGNLRASFFTTSSTGSIARGGGKTHTAEGNATNFKGPDAPQIAANHSATLTEMAPLAKGLSRKYGGPFAVFGFSANYAMWVHEKWDTEVHWKKPQSGPGFFGVHLERNKDKMFQIIRDNSYIR
jgi:hypothetical protein